MKHDAVAWSGGAPTTTTAGHGRLRRLPRPPDRLDGRATWATARPAARRPLPRLPHAGGPAQPASCLDCHANSRPTGGAHLERPPRCRRAHLRPPSARRWATAPPATPSVTAWTGGRFHLAGSANPTTCLPCHDGERPTSTTGWTSTTYTASPFDYGTNAAGVTHGDGLDCATCHAGPGTGAWGGTQTWAGGRFTHGPATVAATTCIACHATSGPTWCSGPAAAARRRAHGFDHATDGTGDCIGCHQATVTARHLRELLQHRHRDAPGRRLEGRRRLPRQHAGQRAQPVRQRHRDLAGPLRARRAGDRHDLHPDARSTTRCSTPRRRSPPRWPGPAGSPDSDHLLALPHQTPPARSPPTPTASSTRRSPATRPPRAARSRRCRSRPAVHRLPLADAAARHRRAAAPPTCGPWTTRRSSPSPVTIGGETASGVADLDCSACHTDPGVAWSDGTFHASIGAAVPADCVACHYPLMADAARADVAEAPTYAMATARRRSPCRPAPPATPPPWPGARTPYRLDALEDRRLPRQRAPRSRPPASTATPSRSRPRTLHAEQLELRAGDGRHRHQRRPVDEPRRRSRSSGSDCVTCHAADAKASGSAWSKADRLPPPAPRPGHLPGLPRGHQRRRLGGRHQQQPAGGAHRLHHPHHRLGHDAPPASRPAPTTRSPTPTSTSPATTAASATPRPGLGGGRGRRGKEWAQARFHASFTAASPLVLNGTTGRCSNCHLNVKPGAAFTRPGPRRLHRRLRHAGLQRLPLLAGDGGTATAPNWKGRRGHAAVHRRGRLRHPQPAASHADHAGRHRQPAAPHRGRRRHLRHLPRRRRWAGRGPSGTTTSRR